MNADFVVPMNGLAQERKVFRWWAGNEFFARFENSEILDAGIEVEVEVEKSGSYIGVDCGVSGEVRVVCDRCLEDLTLPVETGFKLSVKFGEESLGAEVSMDGERETVFLPESDSDLDLSQAVYDYVCLSLPVQRVHEDGGCDPDVLRYLSSECEEPVREDTSSSPFAGLRAMMENND